MSPGTAPSVTLADVEAAIVEQTFTVLPNGRTTICQLTLYNGFTVEGSSACVSKENFDAVKGNKFAREKALDKVWAHLGFRLSDQLYHGAAIVVEDVGPQPPSNEVYQQLVLGEQVLFYERVGDQESPAMLALVSSVINENTVCLTVLAPDGTVHSRTNVPLLGPTEGYCLTMKHYARRRQA